MDQTIEQTEALIAKQRRIRTGLVRDLLTGNCRMTALFEQREGAIGMTSRLAHRA